jgi:hypothetical protein
VTFTAAIAANTRRVSMRLTGFFTFVLGLLFTAFAASAFALSEETAGDIAAALAAHAAPGVSWPGILLAFAVLLAGVLVGRIKPAGGNPKDAIKASLATMATLGFLICLLVLFQASIPQASRELLMFLLGVLASTVKDVYGYYFGSSAGSDKKTDLLASATPAVGNGDAGRTLVLGLPLLALAALFFVTGCAGKTHQETAALTLLTTQQAVVTAAEIGDSLCKSKQLETTKCAAMRDAYGKAGKAYDLAADALILAVRSGDAAGIDRYTLFERQFSTLATDFLSLAVEFNVIPTPGGAK